jgi:hypothetical protein
MVVVVVVVVEMGIRTGRAMVVRRQLLCLLGQVWCRCDVGRRRGWSYSSGDNANRIIRMGLMEIRSAELTLGAGEVKLQMVMLLVKMVDGCSREGRSRVLEA